jgi:rfaE bifunctional protein nucleotidyltransferase chain/domain
MNEQIISEINHLRNKGKKIGLVHGVFDVIHIGHIKYFQEAKKKVDILVASVTDDLHVNKAPGKPIFNLSQRIEVLKNLSCLDYVIKSQKPTSVEIINLIKPHIYFKGRDYKENIDITKNIIEEEKAIKKLNGKIIYTKSEIFSSSKIINTKFSYLNEDFLKFIKKINIKNLKNKFYNNFKDKINKKIIIIGDPIIDIYKYVQASGKSNKATIISTIYKKKISFGGGTFLVANFLSNFCNNINLIQFSNNYNNHLYKKFLKKNINLIKLTTKKRIVKKIRYIDNYSNNKLYQVTENEDNNIEKISNQKYLSILKKIIKKYDYVFVFDYGYSSLNREITEYINEIKIKKKIINCQTNSYNYGYNNFLKFKNAKIMCLDELEFRLGMQDKSKNIINLISDNNSLNKYTNFIVTLGKNGCIIRNKNHNTFIPTIFNAAKDTIGCGDIFISTFGLLKMTNKFSIHEMSIISHISAAIHADSIGKNQSINFEKLYKVIENVIK